MNRYLYCCFLSLVLLTGFKAKGQQTRFVTDDVVRFWDVYDRVRQLPDSAQAVQYIDSHYLAKGTPGLAAIRKFVAFDAADLYQLIRKQHRYMASIRSATLRLGEQQPLFEQLANRFTTLKANYSYPAVYFVMGAMLTGGTASAKSDKVILGAEMITGTKAAAIDSLHPFYQNYMRINPGVRYILAHELVHTQQEIGWGQNMNLMGFCLQEGSADFITEILLQDTVSMPYLRYGRAHADSVRAVFSRHKRSDADSIINLWLYNGMVDAERADLGYYVGYEICRRYYQRARNKARAVRDILAINYNSKKAVYRFYRKSRYEQPEMPGSERALHTRHLPALALSATR